MNILLANDDGIDAKGIHELADALKGLGDLYISAQTPSEAPADTGSPYRSPSQ